MEIIRLRTAPPDRLARILNRANARVFDSELLSRARRTIEEVRARGDEVLLEYTRRWDQVVLTVDRLRVTPQEVEAARDGLAPALISTLASAIERTRRFNERLRPADWMEPLEDGIVAGARFTPLESVGVYVPSGKGRFPSTCVTVLTPARVAGVKEIAVLVPPRPDGSVDPALLVACDLLEVQTIYRCNGVAGIAAFAVGTDTVPSVPALVGPGNPQVVATQLVAQTLGVRMLALLGPTEAVVLADDSADPRRLALDVLNEAEHGTDSAVLLVTDSDALAHTVIGLLPEALARLPEPRRQFAQAALSGGGGVLVAGSLEEAVAFVNRYAPEHLQIVTRQAEAVATRIRNAGEILIGPFTPFSAGNYAIGVPAALPTGGAARVASGITALSFLKLTSLAQLDEQGLAKVRPIVEQLGTYEGFPAHVMAVTDR